jgi:hypothetical protein
VAPEPAWHVRILNSERTAVFGAGILIDRRRIVTCAHVIIEALGVVDVSEVPVGVVGIDFPQCEEAGIRTARVTADGWFPERDSAGDLAVLEVDGDEVTQATPAPLRPAGDPERRMILVLGHPRGHDLGVWARARLIGRGGPRKQWIQMDGLSHTGKRIQKGFSGAGVWDEENEAVIGCVVVEDRSEEDRVAWMIPVEVIASYWQKLQSLLQQEERQEQPRRPQRQEQRRIAPMSAGDRRRLVAMLLTIRVIHDPSSRALFVDALERQFAGRLWVSRRDGDLYDILDLVDACLEHPGALHELVELLRRYHADESELRLVEEVADAVEAVDPFPLLRPSDRNSLYRLLGTLEEYITADMVMRCHHEAVGPLSSTNIDPFDLPSVVRALESATANPDELPPLVRFVEELSRRLPQRLASGLRAWVDDFSGRESIPRYQISRLRISSSPPPPAPTTGYVMTELSPYGADERRYITRISLRHDGPRDRVLRGQVLHDDGMPLTMTEIPALFDYVLSSVWDAATVEIEDVVIEFLLPIELLNHAVDQWPVQTDVVAHPVCVDHLVVVRSTNRVQLRRSHAQWRLKTNRLRSGQSAIRWMDPYDMNGMDQLYYDLASEGSPCLILTRPPVPTRSLGRDAVSIGIRTGVPVIVWCRDEANAASLTARLRAHFAQSDVTDLPILVQRLRTDNVRFGDPVGAHITLVWDLADQPVGPVVRHQAPRL